MLLLLLFIIAILLLPLEAQEAVAQGVGAVLMHPLAPYFIAGAAGALVIGLFFFNHVWNALSYQIYLDDVKRAEDGHKRRKKG
jgi:hypothetical protein